MCLYLLIFTWISSFYFLDILGGEIGKYFRHFSHNHLNAYYHSLPFCLFGIHSLILPLIPLQLFVHGLLSYQLLLFFPSSNSSYSLLFIIYLVFSINFIDFLSSFLCLWKLSWFDSNFCTDEWYQANHHITPMP